MNDRFLEELKADWRSGGIDPGRMLESLDRRRRRLRLLLALEAAGGAAAFAAAIGFAWRARAEGSALFALAAAALLSAAALSLLAVRPAPLPPIGEGPLGMLQSSLRSLAELERAVARWRWSAWILLGCSAAVWLLHASGRAGLSETALLSTAWGGTALAIGLWSGRRGRQIRREREAAGRLIAEYRAAEA